MKQAHISELEKELATKNMELALAIKNLLITEIKPSLVEAAQPLFDRLAEIIISLPDAIEEVEQRLNVRVTVNHTERENLLRFDFKNKTFNQIIENLYGGKEA